MITILDIKKSVVELLKNNFQYEVYGNDVIEGYNKPSFFVQIKPITISNETINQTFYSYFIVVTYFQKEKNEIDNLKMIEQLKSVIGMKLRVKERYLQTDDYACDWIGEEETILQVSFNVSFYEKQEKNEINKIAKEFIFETEE